MIHKEFLITRKGFFLLKSFGNTSCSLLATELSNKAKKVAHFDRVMDHGLTNLKAGNQSAGLWYALESIHNLKVHYATFLRAVNK